MARLKVETRAGDIVQLVECLVYRKPQAQSPALYTLGVELHTYNYHTQEAKAGGSSHPQLHRVFEATLVYMGVRRQN